MTRQLFNLTLFLALAVELTSCNGQVKTNLPNDNGNTSKTITDEQAKLIKTQGSQPGDNVNCSLQDKVGNLWFGTTGEGLYKYNGESFIQYTSADGLNSNHIWCILEDTSGKIWIGTSAGIYLNESSELNNERL